MLLGVKRQVLQSESMIAVIVKKVAQEAKVLIIQWINSKRLIIMQVACNESKTRPIFHEAGLPLTL
jgi:hypothetical protein